MVFDFLCCVNGWFSLRYCICFSSQTTVFVAPAAPADLGFSHPFDVNRFASYGFGWAKKNLKSKREDSHLTYDLWIFKGCTITTLIRWRQSCLVSNFPEPRERNWMALPDILRSYVTMPRYGPNYRHQFFWTTYLTDFLYQDQVLFKAVRPYFWLSSSHSSKVCFPHGRPLQTSSMFLCLLGAALCYTSVCLPVPQNSFPHGAVMQLHPFSDRKEN